MRLKCWKNKNSEAQLKITGSYGGGQAQKILSNNFFISADYKSAPKTALDAILKFSIFPPGGAQVPDYAYCKIQDGGRSSFISDNRAK